MGNRRKRQVQIHVDVKTAKAIRALRALGAANHRTFNKMARDIRRQNAGWTRLKTNLVVVNQALQLMSTLVNRTAGSIVRMTREAMAGDRAMSLLAGTLDRSGVGWAQSRDRLLEFSAELQRTAGIAAGETEATMQLVAEMGRGSIRTAEDVLNATEFVMNFSAVTGKSTESMARIMARVAAGEVKALKSASAELTQELEAMQAAGAGTSEMLAFLASEMRGAAADLDPLAINMARINLAYAETRTAIGGILTDALRASGVLPELAGHFEDLAEAIKDPTTQAGTFAREAMSLIVGAAGFGAEAVIRLAQGFVALADGYDLAIAAAESGISRFELVRLRLERVEKVRHQEFLMRHHQEAIAVREQLDLRENALRRFAEGEEEQRAFLTPIDVPGGFGRISFEALDDDLLQPEMDALVARLHHSLRGAMHSLDFGQIGNLAGEIQAIDYEILNFTADLERATEAQRQSDQAFQSSLNAFTNHSAAFEVGIDALRRYTSMIQNELPSAVADLDLFGGEEGDPVLDPEPAEEAGRGWFVAFLIGFHEELEASREELRLHLAEAIFVDPFLMIRDVIEMMGKESDDVGSSIAEGITEGLGIATNSLKSFSSIVPKLMDDAATSGVEKFASVMQLMSVAADTAAAVGLVVYKTTGTIFPLLGQFFAFAAASAAFSAALGAGGGGGGGGPPPSRGATGIDTGDVFSSTRPEAARTGQARVINLQIGTVMNNDQTRRAIAAAVTESEILGEIERGG